MKKVSVQLYGKNSSDVYSKLPKDMTENNFNITFSKAHFTKILKSLPNENAVIIEVGTHYGNSAIGMAELMQEHGKKNFQIICIDTWLGSLEHSPGEEFYNPNRFFDWTNGEMWDRFRVNVVQRKVQDFLIPLRQTSITAAKILQNLNIQADLIYVDGSHEQGDVILDINAYYPLLKTDGLMIGDDYNWNGVRHDVELFSKNRKIDINVKEAFDTRCKAVYWQFTKKSNGYTYSYQKSLKRKVKFLKQQSKHYIRRVLFKT